MKGESPKPRGGAGRGQGRKPSTNPTSPISIRLTAAQHAAYMSRGGAKWLKALLEDLVDGGRR